MTDPTWHDEPGSSYGSPPPPGTGPYPPPGYGPGQLPPPWYELEPRGQTPPADERPTGPGLFGSLLDRSFENLATVKLLRMLYTLAILCVTGFNLVLFLFGWSLAAGTFWPFLGWTFVIGVPVMWLAELIMVRVVVEYLIVQHQIAADIAVVRETVKDIRAANS